ncbi:MAG TPA: alpha/beta hydrolase [Roseiarcus sp.]
MARFLITVRSIEAGAFGGGLGKIRYLSVPDGAVPAPAHEVTSRAWLAAIMATFTTVPSSVRGASPLVQGEALFIVHGFNEAVADVALLHDAIGNGLAASGGGYSPTLISFDWPSAGSPFAYLPDLDVAARTAVDLVNAAVRPLLRAQTPNCQVTVNALAHSMGAFVLRAALGHADDGIVTGGDWMLGQLALVAGDVEASAFVSGDKDTQSMMGHAYRLTNYFSRYDEVLQISNAKRAGVEERVGRIGLPQGAAPSTVNVDCSARYAAVPDPSPRDPIKTAEFSHDWYFSDANFYRDLAQTLKGAVDRNVVAMRTVGSGGAFALAV